MRENICPKFVCYFVEKPGAGEKKNHIGWDRGTQRTKQKTLRKKKSGERCGKESYKVGPNTSYKLYVRIITPLIRVKYP